MRQRVACGKIKKKLFQSWKWTEKKIRLWIGLEGRRGRVAKNSTACKANARMAGNNDANDAVCRRVAWLRHRPGVVL